MHMGDAAYVCCMIYVSEYSPMGYPPRLRIGRGYILLSLGYRQGWLIEGRNHGENTGLVKLIDRGFDIPDIYGSLGYVNLMFNCDNVESYVPLPRYTSDPNKYT
jgi:hypothetical protein